MAATIRLSHGPSDVLVREATHGDDVAIRRLVRVAYREYERKLTANVYAAYLADLLAIERTAATVRLVADVDGEVIGTVTFYPDAVAAGFGWPAGWSAFRALAVDPAHRGRGIGAELVNACVSRAAAAGAPTIGLHTAELMTSAVRLYERLGFTRIAALDIDAVDVVDVSPTDAAPLIIAYQLGLQSEIDTYPLGRSAAETQRLIAQHQIYAPITRQLFVAAGIGRGMNVLDLGSGAGDVAMLVADLVGPAGKVVGVDANPDILETARSRAAAAGWSNVEFVRSDLDSLRVETDVDAVVGRWILMYLADPAALLRRVSAHLRPGALIVVQESADLTAPVRTVPPTPLHDEINRWTTPVDTGVGPTTNMGHRLYRTFIDAGLPAPELRLEAPLGGGPEWPGYAFLAGSVRSLLPILEQYGAATSAEVDVDTVEERLRAEVVEHHGVQILPAVVGAWSRRP